MAAQPPLTTSHESAPDPDHDPGRRAVASVLGPQLTGAEAARLPAKLQWPLVGWYRATGAFAAAAALLEAIEGRSGETAQLMEERARLAFALGRPDEAKALLEERVRRAPAATAWAGLARLHLEVGDVEAAAAISAELSREHPEMVTVGALAADVARARGDLDAARAYYEGGLEERPDNVGALLGLARLAVVGSPREARPWLDRALAAAGEAPTPAQLSTAAAIAELCDQPMRAAALRTRAALLEAERTAALAGAIDAALGRAPGSGGRETATTTRGATNGAVPTAVGSLLPKRLEAIPDLGLPPDEPTAVTPVVGSAAPAAETGPELVAAVTTPEVAVDARTLETLRRDFGHEALRPGQAAVIANVLARRDTLATMPTGAGKSLTFQLPAMLLGGTTLVISPLIALMKDQVESLPPSVRERTALVNSSLSPEEQRRVLDGLADGAYKLIYAAPERLRQHAFLRALRQAGTSLVVVDEAHCISLWGHDFRPDYLSIPTALPALGDPPVLAITATATPRMAAAIGTAFGRDLERVKISLFRSNLFYEVHRVANREEKVAKALAVCRQERGAGIVYVSSRKDAEAIAGLLQGRYGSPDSVSAIPYHAGLDPETRARNQERFMGGQVRVVVATVAFGMGVDKADVRFIVHLSPPKSLEAYAQESGRAGRDGKPARCVLLTAPADQSNLNRLARRDETDIDTLRRVYAGVKRAASGRWALVDPPALLPPPSYDDDPDDTADPRIALGLLEQADLVHRHPDAPVTYTLRRAPEIESEATAPGVPAIPADDALWARFAAWADLGDAGWAGLTIRTAEACEALGVSPVELGRVLGGRSDWLVREGTRLVCLELRPVGNDAGARLAEILTRAHAEARQRIAQVMAYAGGGRCRHAMLANHLGEALAPCGTACDFCTGTVKSTRRERGGAAANEEGAPTQRSETTAADAMAVLEAVGSLPYPMGKTGLTKLLIGSVESRLRGDRSRAFGALAGLTRGKVDGLLDRLIADGFLYRDLNHEFKVITLTEPGADATVEDLAGYEGRPRRAVVATTADEDAELSAEEAGLLDRLYAWRRDRASRDAMPPYVIAHNTALQAVALARPSTLEALGEIKGFGPAKVERYGDEVLAVVAAS